MAPLAREAQQYRSAADLTATSDEKPVFLARPVEGELLDRQSQSQTSRSQSQGGTRSQLQSQTLNKNQRYGQEKRVQQTQSQSHSRSHQKSQSQQRSQTEGQGQGSTRLFRKQHESQPGSPAVRLRQTERRSEHRASAHYSSEGAPVPPPRTKEYRWQNCGLRGRPASLHLGESRQFHSSLELSPAQVEINTLNLNQKDKIVDHHCVQVRTSSLVRKGPQFQSVGDICFTSSRAVAGGRREERSERVRSGSCNNLHTTATRIIPIQWAGQVRPIYNNLLRRSSDESFCFCTSQFVRSPPPSLARGPAPPPRSTGRCTGPGWPSTGPPSLPSTILPEQSVKSSVFHYECRISDR